jgi:hypothetical protein
MVVTPIIVAVAAEDRIPGEVGAVADAAEGAAAAGEAATTTIMGIQTRVATTVEEAPLSNINRSLQHPHLQNSRDLQQLRMTILIVPPLPQNQTAKNSKISSFWASVLCTAYVGIR